MHPSQPAPGQRICVVGTSGSGKTFVAQALADSMGLRYVSNDALIWRADWQEVPREERYNAFESATRDGGWTFDGNLGPSREDELVLSRCDTLVWLDLPRWQVMWSITVRTLWRAVTRQRLFHNNVERWSTALSSDSMIAWAWRTYPRRKSQYARLFTDPAHAARARIRLTSRGEVNRWLHDLSRAHP
jgi:adenylate kinase family enzyme